MKKSTLAGLTVISTIILATLITVGALITQHPVLLVGVQFIGFGMFVSFLTSFIRS